MHKAYLFPQSCISEGILFPVGGGGGEGRGPEKGVIRESEHQN